MKKTLILFCVVAVAFAAFAANIIQSGWTTTGNADTARTALNALKDPGNVLGALTNNGAGVVGWYAGYPTLSGNNTFSGNNLFSGNNTFLGTLQFSANINVSANVNITGGITNASLSADSIVKTDVNKRLTSVVNGAGALTNNGSGVFGWFVPGSVTSVGLTMPSIFNVSGSPITDSGVLGVTLTTETPNTFFSGPNGGSPTTPTFRFLTDLDLATTTAAFVGVQNQWTSGQQFPDVTVTNKLSAQTVVITNTSFYSTNAFPLTPGTVWDWSRYDQTIITNADFNITAIGGLTNYLDNMAQLEISNAGPSQIIVHLLFAGNPIGPNSTNNIYIPAGLEAYVNGDCPGMRVTNYCSNVGH